MALPKPYSGPAQPLDTVRPEEPKPKRKLAASTAWERKQKWKIYTAAYPMVCPVCGDTYDSKSLRRYGERCFRCKRAGRYSLITSQPAGTPPLIAKIKAAQAARKAATSDNPAGN